MNSKETKPAEKIADMSNIAAIKKFFGEVTISELKKVALEDRQELGELCREALQKLEDAEK